MPYKDKAKQKEYNARKGREWYLAHKEEILARKKARLGNLPIRPSKKNAPVPKFCQWCKKETVSNASRPCLKCQKKHDDEIIRKRQIKDRREKANAKKWRKAKKKWLTWLFKQGMVEPLITLYLTPQQMTEFGVGFRNQRCNAALSNIALSLFGTKQIYTPVIPKPPIPQPVIVRPAMCGCWIQPHDYTGAFGRSLSLDGPSYLATQYRREKESRKAMCMKQKEQIEKHIAELKKTAENDKSHEFFTMLAFASAQNTQEEK